MKREPEAIEKYLSGATKGLWGRKRQEVREELRAHLEERMLAHRIGGLPEQDAIEKALAELGSPQLVNTGMTRLYTLPTVAGSGLAVMALCLSVLALWPQGVAQLAVSASFYLPTKECVTAQQIAAHPGWCPESGTLWLEPESFKAEMRRQGVKVDEGATNLTLTFPDGAYASLSTAPTEIRTDNDDTSIFTVAGTIAFNELFRELLDQPGPLWFEGWDNPVVHIGAVRFQLGTDKQKITGDRIYTTMLASIFPNVFTESPPDSKTPTPYYFFDPRRESWKDAAPKTRLEVLEPGVYGVITSVRHDLFPEPWIFTPKSDDMIAAFEVMRPDETGTLVARLPEGVKFVTTLSEVDSNTAVLVRFADSPSTDAVGYSVVDPADIALSANR